MKARKPSTSSFGQRIFDRGDRIVVEPSAQHGDHLGRVETAIVESQNIGAVAPEFGCCDVERNHDLLARPQAGRFDRQQQRFKCFFVGGKSRPITALVGDALQLSRLLHEDAGGMIDFRRPIQRFGKGHGCRTHHHEILHIDSSRRVGAATKIWISGKGMRTLPCPARNCQSGMPAAAALACSIAIEVATKAFAAKAGFVRRAVKFDQAKIDCRLIGCILAGEVVGDFTIDVGDGATHVENRPDFGPCRADRRLL